MLQEEYVSDAVELLKKLIATPSVSRNEKDAADIMEQTIRSYGFEPQREANNIWIIDPHYDESRPTLLLNAHIDTVKPVASWTRDPFHRMLKMAYFTVWAATIAVAVSVRSSRFSECLQRSLSAITLFI